MFQRKTSMTMALIILLGSASFGRLALTTSQPVTGGQILECARHNWVEGTFHGIISMNLTRPEYGKRYRMEAWTSASDKVLIRMLEPPEESGSGYLKLDEELWYYHPAAGQAVSLPPSALSESFFGTDLSLEDLYRGTLNEHYDVKLLGTRPTTPEESGVAGDKIHQLRLIPKADAPVVYGKLELRVRASDCSVLLLDYYDQRETLIRQAMFSRFVRVGEKDRTRIIPLQMTFDDFLKKGSRTVETIESYEFDVAIPDSRFTLNCLVSSQCGQS